MTEARTIVGLIEKITLFGKTGTKIVTARIDTGATRSSIDEVLARELETDPSHRSATVRSAEGSRKRPVVKVRLLIAGRKMHMEFTLANRKHMHYRVLIGQNILKRGFLIDPAKDTKNT